MSTGVPSHVSSDQVLSQFMQKVGEQVYTEPTQARRLLLQGKATVEEAAEPLVQIKRALMLGNVANQEHSFEEAKNFLDGALAQARIDATADVQVEIAADLLGPMLNLGEITDAARLLDETRDLAISIESPLQWWLYVREGFLHLKLSELDHALRCFGEARDRQPELLPGTTPIKHAYYAALLSAGFGRVYMQGQEPARSIEAYLAVVELCAQFNMRGRLPYHYLDLGRAYMDADKRAEAVHFFELTKQVSGEHDRHARASALANLGYYAVIDKDYIGAHRHFDEAEHNYATARPIAHADLSQIELWRAAVALEQNNFAEANEAYARSLNHAQEGENQAQLARVCKSIAEYYASRGMYEDAYSFRLKFEDIQHSVDAQANDQRLSELELRNEVEERRRESELFRLRAARLQLKALRAQMNPHFIFNALNSIQEFITNQKATEAATHLAHFARLMRQSLDYSEREAITLEEEIDFLNNYLALNQALRYSEPFSYEIHVDEDLEEDLIMLPAMLVQPYVENALEHGIRLVKQGHIQVLFSSPAGDDDTLLITIQDNGVGRKQASQQVKHRKSDHKSMGTDITKTRLELLNRGIDTTTAVEYIDLEDTDGSSIGTRVLISLPIQWRA